MRHATPDELLFVLDAAETEGSIPLLDNTSTIDDCSTKRIINQVKCINLALSYNLQLALFLML